MRKRLRIRKAEEAIKALKESAQSISLIVPPSELEGVLTEILSSKLLPTRNGYFHLAKKAVPH